MLNHSKITTDNVEALRDVLSEARIRHDPEDWQNYKNAKRIFEGLWRVGFFGTDAVYQDLHQAVVDFCGV